MTADSMVIAYAWHVCATAGYAWHAHEAALLVRARVSPTAVRVSDAARALGCLAPGSRTPAVTPLQASLTRTSVRFPLGSCKTFVCVCVCVQNMDTYLAVFTRTQWAGMCDTSYVNLCVGGPLTDELLRLLVNVRGRMIRLSVDTLELQSDTYATTAWSIDELACSVVDVTQMVKLPAVKRVRARVVVIPEDITEVSETGTRIHAPCSNMVRHSAPLRRVGGWADGCFPMSPDALLQQSLA